MTKEPITLQEAFNQIWDWFVVKKNKRSIDIHNIRPGGGVTCEYNGANGAHCAVGVLIKDFDILAGSNNDAIESLLDRCPAIKDYLSKITLWQLTQLQDIHDEESKVPEMFNENVRLRLIKFAANWFLKVPQES